MAEGLTSQANPLPDHCLVAEYLNAKARPIRAGRTRGLALDYRFKRVFGQAGSKRPVPDGREHRRLQPSSERNRGAIRIPQGNLHQQTRFAAVGTMFAAVPERHLGEPHPRRHPHGYLLDRPSFVAAVSEARPFWKTPKCGALPLLNVKPSRIPLLSLNPPICRVWVG